MSFILIGLVIVSFLMAATSAVIVLINNFKSPVHRWLAVFLTFAGAWGLIVNLQNSSMSLNYNLIIVRLTFVAAVVMSYALFGFVIAVAHLNLSKATRYLVSFAGLTICILMFSDLVIPSVSVIEGTITPERLPLYYAVISYILLLCTSGLYMLHQSIKKSRNRFTRNQLTTIFFGLSGGIVIGVFTNIILPNILGSIAPSRFAWISIVVWTVLLMYAVVRNRFLDIRLAAVRTAVYALSLLTLATVYYLLALVISETVLDNSVLTQPAGIILALLLSFIFQPVKRFFDHWTNKLFYKDNYNVDDFFSRLNRALSSTTDLRYLLEKAASEISSTLRSEQVIFIVYTSHGRYISVGTDKHVKIPSSDIDAFSDITKNSQGVIDASLLEEGSSFKRLMLSHRLEFVMPLYRDKLLIGYLCLGSHRTSGYSVRDIKVLTAIRDELIIAIQNSTSVHEIKELNASLQQKIADATRELRLSNNQLQRLDKAKDEFVSMASHQLRTPLTSVKGYISMVLEGDAGKISDKQEHLLSEAFISSERMVRLISDFLNVSRLQTGKFIIDKRPLNLAKVVEQELDSLSTNASSRGLKFSYKPPVNFPILNIDEDKIRQVIMNFADNAIYYSGESTEIKVSLSIEADNCIFTVKDAGIGVPRGERAQLFSKFYRASNARKQRPDGTGVGLFLAKKVITAHGGEVIFESTEGKGSTFGFSLPIAALRTADDTNQLENQPDNN